MKSLTHNGLSTTTENDQFACEQYVSVFDRKPRVQWDYRDSKGKLHSGVAKTLEQAVMAAGVFGYKREAE